MDSFYNFKDGKLLYQTPQLSITHVPSYKAIFLKISGYIEEQDTATFFASTLEAAEKTDASYLIGDFSDFKGSNLNQAKYASQKWIPQLADKGITHIAVNIPKSDFGAFTLRIAMGPKAHELFEVYYFKDLAEGITWLKEIAG